MKCPKCSKEIMNDSEFCNYCGEQIVSDLNHVADPRTLSRKRKLIATFISIAVILVTCISIFSYIFLIKKTYKYNSIDIARYLSSRLTIDDITDKGDIPDPSYGTMNITTWVDSDTSNRIISFNSDYKAKKYCDNSEGDYKYRYGNIVLELSSKMDEDTVLEYKNTMANIDSLSDEDIKKENRFPFISLDSFISTLAALKNETGSDLFTFKEETVDKIPSDGVYCNSYRFDFAEPVEDTSMNVYFNEDKQVIQINMHSDDIDFLNADGSTKKMNNTLYPTAVSLVLLALDSDIDWEKISDHLHEERYETTAGDYVITNYHDSEFHFYIAEITKKSSK